MTALNSHDRETRPVPATVRSERGGQAADLKTASLLAYPLLAQCAACGRTIRLLNTSVLGEWEHADVPAPRPPT